MTQHTASADSTWYSNDSATFGDRLADARQALDMSAEDLARRIGVKLKTLNAWEEDLAEPRANKLSLLAGLLNVSLVWLLTGEGEGIAPLEPRPALSEDFGPLLLELRQLRGEMHKNADRLGLLEKRLLQTIQDEM